MHVVFLLGSGLRVGALRYCAERGIDIRRVFIPRGARFASLVSVVHAETGIDAHAAKRADLHEALSSARPDVIICVGWPLILEPAIVDGPWLLLNTHPTLLPKYRGPNPWYYILANGEPQAGVTVHRIDNGMDSGPILHQVPIALSPFDTYRSLRAMVVATEPRAVFEALQRVREGNAEFRPQDERLATTYTERRTPVHSEIDPQKPLTQLVDSIRACDPEAFPAFFYHHGQKVFITLQRESRPQDEHPESL